MSLRTSWIDKSTTLSLDDDDDDNNANNDLDDNKDNHNKDDYNKDDHHKEIIFIFCSDFGIGVIPCEKSEKNTTNFFRIFDLKSQKY